MNSTAAAAGRTQNGLRRSRPRPQSSGRCQQQLSLRLRPSRPPQAPLRRSPLRPSPCQTPTTGTSPLSPTPRSLMHASFCASPGSCRSGRPRSPLQPSPSECMHGSCGRTASRIWCQLPRCGLVTLPRFLNEHPRRSVSTTLMLDIDPCTTTATPTDHHLVDVSNPVLLEGFATGIGASTPYTTY